VLTSTRSKKEYDIKRVRKMRMAISEQKGCTTSFTEWMNSCSDNSLRLWDSDLSSTTYSTSESGGKASESVRLVYSGSEGESVGEYSERSESECEIPDKINHDNELEILSIAQKKTEKTTNKSKKDINESVFKEPQSNSHSTQDHPTEGLFKKRNLSISSSCGEKSGEVKSPQKPSRSKKRKKKNKKDSMIKRYCKSSDECRT